MLNIVNKPWGSEEWLELNDFYCVKKINFKAGNQCSLQYHEYKLETIYLLSGEAELWIEVASTVDTNYPTKVFIFREQTYRMMIMPMKAGDFITIKPHTAHRLVAITDVVTLETSTPEVNDCIRLHDDLGRPDGRIESEHA